MLCLQIAHWLHACCRGPCVCLVGEWDGDTAESTFTAQLQVDFRLIQRCALPNWTDTAHELTIWERRPVEPAEAGPEQPDASVNEAVNDMADVSFAPSLQLVYCSACDVPHGRAAARAGDKGGRRVLRRCRLCREVAYCSAECRRAHAKRHTEIHALRLLFLQRKMSYIDDRDFADLRL